MCVGAPKPPKVQPIPDRQPMLLPDNGDPSIAASLRGASGQLRTSSMIFANKNGSLGAPSVAAPLGTGGY